jgi:hypothetical protein
MQVFHPFFISMAPEVPVELFNRMRDQVRIGRNRSLDKKSAVK